MMIGTMYGAVRIVNWRESSKDVRIETLKGFAEIAINNNIVPEKYLIENAAAIKIVQKYNRVI
jgi:hypothetical protein